MLIKVTAIKPIINRRLLLQFNTGGIRIVDFNPMLLAPAFIPLIDEELYGKVRLEYGVPV